MSSCPVSTLHIRTLQSPLLKPPICPLQEATSEPSAEKLTPLTRELYFGFKLVTTLTTLCNGRLRLCRFLEVSGNTFVILVYVYPPVSGGKRQRYMWPSSDALHVPNSTSQILRVLSQDADTMVLPWGEKTHAVTESLPFFEMSGNTFVRSSTPLPRRAGEPKKKAWLTCGPRASSGARPCLGPTA